jgi:hypothetical protein
MIRGFFVFQTDISANVPKAASAPHLVSYWLGHPLMIDLKAGLNPSPIDILSIGSTMENLKRF